jgi:hypothetical protein
VLLICQVNWLYDACTVRLLLPPVKLSRLPSTARMATSDPHICNDLSNVIMQVVAVDYPPESQYQSVPEILSGLNYLTASVSCIFNGPFGSFSIYRPILLRKPLTFLQL